MRYYSIPRFIQKLYVNKAIWNIPSRRKIIYLTFDDGPSSEITQWILDILNHYNAKATFFCVGDNVVKHPEIFNLIKEKGHAVGNHTYNHLKGWKTDTGKYVENVEEANELIDVKLFRPPYGKIKKSQARLLQDIGYKIVMWSFLSYDFDVNLDQMQAWKQMIRKTKPGSIIVFHDHKKAFKNLKELLPRTLDFFSKKGYVFEKIAL